MRTICVHEGPEYRVNSTGNGLFYTLIHKPTGKSVFFQGDDAGLFREALTDAEENTGLAIDDIGAFLWCDHEYGTLAQHEKVVPWGPYCRLSDKRTFVPAGNVAAIL